MQDELTLFHAVDMVICVFLEQGTAFQPRCCPPVILVGFTRVNPSRTLSADLIICLLPVSRVHGRPRSSDSVLHPWESIEDHA